MTEEISTIIKQAKSQARTEKLFKILGAHSKKLIYGAIAVIIASLLFFAYKIYQNNAAEKYSAMLHQSLVYQQTGQLDLAKKELEKIVDSSAPSGVHSLASLRLAAFLIEEGNVAAAKKLFLQVNECGSCDDYIRDVAGLLLVKMMIADTSIAQDSKELITQIAKIKNRAKPLKNEIALQFAMLQLFNKNLEESYKIFDEILRDEEASQNIKAQAKDGVLMVLAKGFKVKK